ncbi:sulfotransferase family protein [Myceligenerans pegani]|uniref:Sulfotransferase n=1 Tax=Myceligenerans pegani TaxID=2776917 RepID=A0ABR9MW03_9MICO|nr:sulfotransferase [Myceligenerans sp. TRM 65318]MBE1875231.1 sulfotransferase [Myceligenerans sp. TRM 65318]MBE3017502.1 sulfotransferase [Myceligenerans sp. TRM 65318]
MSIDPAPWDGHRLVFIGGMHRSGTTLVADILGTVPGSSGLRNTGVPMDEGQHLQRVYTGARGRMDRWAYAPEAHLTEHDATPHAARELWDAWAPYWDRDARFLVEKSPPNLTKMRYLQELYPHARFIAVTRHPVVQALAIRKWAGLRTGRYGVGLPRLVGHWVHAHEVFADDAECVENLLVVRYEHLMREPGDVLGRVAEFLGTPPIPADAVDVHRSDTYERAWHATCSGVLRRAAGHLRRAGRRPWRARQAVAREIADPALLPRYRREIADRYAARIARLGYDVDNLHDAAPWGVRALSRRS